MQFPLKKLNIEFPHEKLCPKLYKAHAPAKAVEIITKIETEPSLKKEYVESGKAWGDIKATTVLFLKKSYPWLICVLLTNEEMSQARFLKVAGRPRITILYKGTRVVTYPEHSTGYKVVKGIGKKG